MPKWLKAVVAVLLLPLCLGCTKALVRLIGATGSADTFWAAFLAGAACWVVVFLLLPRPMWLYVVGHELTHAVWTWLFGGRVTKFKATAKGGHVHVTKTNFVIALAPYFFPIYAALVALVFGLGHLLWNWSAHAGIFHLLLGAAYAFHLTLTAHILRTEQSDITQQGYLFSAVVIYLGNVAVLLLALPLLTDRGSLLSVLGWCLHETGQVLGWLSRRL